MRPSAYCLQASEAVVQYLEPGTKKPLMLAIEQQLLKPHTSALVEKGFDALVDTNRWGRRSQAVRARRNAAKLAERC